MHASQIVNHLLELLDEAPPSWRLEEASVYLPPRSTKWVAVFTGVEPGQQVRRSTGLTDRQAALLLARKWEREAARARSKVLKKPTIRTGAERPDVLTQKEVAAALGMSERGVREAERRALAKLRNHPALRQMWTAYKSSMG
jgi:hypothetical protein